MNGARTIAQTATMIAVRTRVTHGLPGHAVRRGVRHDHRTPRLVRGVYIIQSS